jgi:hypothetical protein
VRTRGPGTALRWSAARTPKHASGRPAEVPRKHRGRPRLGKAGSVVRSQGRKPSLWYRVSVLGSGWRSRWGTFSWYHKVQGTLRAFHKLLACRGHTHVQTTATVSKGGSPCYEHRPNAAEGREATATGPAPLLQPFSTRGHTRGVRLDGSCGRAGSSGAGGCQGGGLAEGEWLLEQDVEVVRRLVDKGAATDKRAGGACPPRRS